MRTLAACLFATAALSACTDDDSEGLEVPGRAEPSCAMTWRAFRVSAIELGANYEEARALGLDIDRADRDGADNQIGTLMSSMRTLFPESWDPETAFNARLAGGQTLWVLELGSCADGSEGRVVSARATDVDGDGRLEIVDRGLAAVGRSAGGQTQITGERGVGWVPVGALFGASPTASTDAWQLGVSLTAELSVATGNLTGRFGIGLNPDTETSLTPVQNFFNERLAAGTSQGARDIDTNHDGTIDFEENRRMVLGVLSYDLDLARGTCDDVDCYAPDHRDGANEHASLGIGITGVEVELE